MNTDLTAIDALAPGILALICGVVMIWPVISHAASGRWVGMLTSLVATGLLVNIGIGTTMTQLEQGLFPASTHWSPPSTRPVLNMAWITSILMLVVFVIMCSCAKGYQIELFSAAALVGVACASNLRELSESEYSTQWLHTQRICEGIAVFLLVICGPVRAGVRWIARRV